MKWQSLLLFCCVAACGSDFVPGDGGVDGGARGDGGGGVRVCTTSFRYQPSTHVDLVSVAGEWNNFDPTQGQMTLQSDGSWAVSLKLPTGAYGYKIVLGTAANQQWILDPGNPGYTKWVGGFENSLVEVGDCMAPELVYSSSTKSAQGAFHAEVSYVDGAGRAGTDASLITATLDGQPAPGFAFDAASGRITVDAMGLARGKHRLIVSAQDHAGHAADDFHMPFWIEAEDFDFRDGIMYFAFTDRFVDGDTTNDSPVANCDTRANYQGGDYVGIQQKIDSGYLDQLGVRSLWISPPNPNPDHFELGSDNRNYSGYHGYWPTDGRSIQKRFGDAAAMKAMIASAHAHGIRVLVDAVLNHVHTEHPYYLNHQHDGWFNPLMLNGMECVCGDPGCGDWDATTPTGNLGLYPRQTCWFAPYLPDLNYENFDAAKAMVDDELTWARDFDVDGFRVDAVKHFLEIVPRRLRSKLHDQFEHVPGEQLYYLVGETFTGGSDDERRFIASFLGPVELTAQFDFPLYWNILGAFATNGEQLSDLDNAVMAGEGIYGGAPMSPFLGNHDVVRFLSTAANQISGDPKQMAWDSPPPQPTDPTPYQRLQLAIAFLFTQPGVPLIYYGDEIGMPGAGDPDNRRMMRFDADLTQNEQATLDLARKVGQARKELGAIRRGGRYTLWVDGDLYVYARVSGQDVAVIAINRADTARTQAVPLRPESPIPDGTKLQDRLGGAMISPAGGMLPINLPPRTAAIYAP